MLTGCEFERAGLQNGPSANRAQAPMTATRVLGAPFRAERTEPRPLPTFLANRSIQGAPAFRDYFDLYYYCREVSLMQSLSDT